VFYIDGLFEENFDKLNTDLPHDIKYVDVNIIMKNNSAEPLFITYRTKRPINHEEKE
jgi:hypothetical protein